MMYGSCEENPAALTPSTSVPLPDRAYGGLSVSRKETSFQVFLLCCFVSSCKTLFAYKPTNQQTGEEDYCLDHGFSCIMLSSTRTGMGSGTGAPWYRVREDYQAIDQQVCYFVSSYK